MYEDKPRDVKGRFLNKQVAEAVEYCFALMEHKEYPLDYAEDIALANGAGRELTDKQVEQFFAEVASY